MAYVPPSPQVWDRPINPQVDCRSMPLWAKAQPHPQRASVMTPQAVAHRGYSAAYPENSMVGFRAAVEEAGAHGLEADVHLSRDGVLVLAHDRDLKRCFGREGCVSDMDAEDLAELKSIRAPHVGVPQLKELLEYLALPANEKIWLILDIKLHDDAETLFQALSTLINSITPTISWSRRILLGCWRPPYMALASRYLPTIPLCHIGLSPSYALSSILPEARHTAVNLALPTLAGLDRRGKDEFADCAVFAWTVNDEEWMRWCAENSSLVGQRLGGIDAVVTDDPKRFNELVKYTGGDDETWDGVGRPGVNKLLKAWLMRMLCNTASGGLRLAGWYNKVPVRMEQRKVSEKSI